MVKRKTKHKKPQPSRWILITLLLFLGLLTTLFFSRPQPLADPGTLRMLASGKPIPPPDFSPDASFLGEAISVPTDLDLRNTLVGNDTLGVTSMSQYFDILNRHIEVDLTNQKVYAFEGGNKVMEFTISSGKWGRTPTG